MHPINTAFYDNFARALSLLTQISHSNNNKISSQVFDDGFEIELVLDERFSVLLGWDRDYFLYGDVVDNETGCCIGLGWDEFIEFVADYLEF